MISNQHPYLPYTDDKRQGAADFYFAINATFRFIHDKLGALALREYWSELGEKYYRPVASAWRDGGLAAVADYWEDFFSAEPGAEVEVTHVEDEVTLQIRRCPAIAHLRENGRDIVPVFCQHCYFVSEEMARPAGIKVRIEGGNGSCVQVFSPRKNEEAPQDFSRIRKAAST
jgi:hypothetical protein